MDDNHEITSNDHPPDLAAIRLKRLARLGNPATSSSTDLSSGTPAPSKPPSQAPPQLKRHAPSPEFTPADTGRISSLPKPTSTQPSTRSLDEWEDSVISQVYRVTIREQAPRNGFTFLGDLCDEIQAAGRGLTLGIRDLDQVIISTASAAQQPFLFLCGCHHRIVHLIRNHRPNKEDDSYKLNALGEIRRMSVDFCIHALLEPDIFENVAKPPADLASCILETSEGEPLLSMELLSDLSGSFDDNPHLRDIFLVAFETMSSRLSSLDFSGDYQTYTNALERIVNIRTMANLITTSKLFVPLDIRPPDLETSTLLGPYFRLSPLQSGVVDSYFPSPKTQGASALNLAVSSLRLAFQTHQHQLAKVIKALVRVSPQARGRVLDFFALVINLNGKRRALQIQENTVSSDGFMLNITAVLDSLCEPFMDPTFTKVNKINVSYFRQRPRLAIQEETKVNSDTATSNQFYNEEIVGSPNFNSEVFFLAMGAHHVGYIACINNASNLSHHLSEMEKSLERLERERGRFLNSPQLVQLDNSLRLLRERLQKGYSYQAALEGLLSDQGSQSKALSFWTYLAVWVLRLVSESGDYPQTPLKLPLPASPRPEFSNLPEYIIEDVATLFSHIIRSNPFQVTNQHGEVIMIFAISFLRMHGYVRNPYLKAKLVDALYSGTLPFRAGNGKGVLGDLLNGHNFALDNLLHSLMSFYIEVEQTGAHTQFYDKFNIRYNISQVIKSIWTNPNYRVKLGQESRSHPDFFVRFVALLLNDVTFLLDESLSKLSDIHRLQDELSPESSTTLDQQARTERERLLSSNEHHATTYVSLANETVLMVKTFTKEIPDAFVSPELVHRLAGMLDYNLEALVGPKCSNLRVKDPAKYRFEPKNLLSGVIDIYLNLGTRPSFVHAIAVDGRSYNPELFTRAYGILSRFGLKSPEELLLLSSLADAVIEAKRLEEEGEEELGEIPDEFLDPLLFTLMEDPVILPTSKTTIDLSTIKAHLLSDATDPFNRSPLKLSDVIPNTELKLQIEAFKAGRRGR